MTKKYRYFSRNSPDVKLLVKVLMKKHYCVALLSNYLQNKCCWEG